MARITSTPDVLIDSAKAGDPEAMWEIIHQHEPMLRSIVDIVASGNASRDDREDLLQEARCVLIERVMSFDTDGAAELRTVAYRRVYGKVAEAWASMRPGLTVEPQAEVRVRRALAQADGDRDTAFALTNEGKALKQIMLRSTFDAVAEALYGAVSLDAPSRAAGDDDGEGSSIGEQIPDTANERQAVSHEAREQARWILDNIAERQALALRGFYGIGMPQTEDAQMAAMLGHVTLARVRTLRADGIRSARTLCSAHGLAA